MSGLVLDASIALSWFYPEESTPSLSAIRTQIQEEGGLAPGIWPYEIQNALVVGVRRGRATEADCHEFLTLVSRLNIRLDPIEDLLADKKLFDLALSHNLSVYDASYLSLALREGLPLVTLDKALADAAASSGVRVFR